MWNSRRYLWKSCGSRMRRRRLLVVEHRPRVHHLGDSATRRMDDVYVFLRCAVHAYARFYLETNVGCCLAVICAIAKSVVNSASRPFLFLSFHKRSALPSVVRRGRAGSCGEGGGRDQTKAGGVLGRRKRSIGTAYRGILSENKLRIYIHYRSP
jgi:hypothetical protein